jgi:predicted TIM-barrel fold metal-dependent hydrolase
MSDRIFAEDFLPRSELVTPQHPVTRAKFPVIDAHNHLTAHGLGGQPHRPAEEMVRDMDFLNVQAIADLNGGIGDALKGKLERLDFAYPGRFITLCNVDWEGAGTPGFTARAVAALKDDVAAGGRGLKVFKTLGLRVRDPQNKLVLPDDPRIADIWDQAGELGVPVLIHTADPTAFFKPLDRFNERWDELHAHPDWHFYGPEYPPFEELIASLYKLIEAHPGTRFITAHVGCYPENLAFVTQMMEKYPNMYTDFSERLGELGRQPYSAREWFLRFPDRILFGTDVRPSVPWYQTYFRGLETRDEYFDYGPGDGQPRQGRWKIHGLHLPDDVLKKVYYDNAARLYRV